MSQLDLALQADVSARHISFVETGRSQPSRDMVIRLAATLNVPLRDRNRLLLAAGYAPAYLETNLDDGSMAPVQQALAFILRKHEPYPAFVLDSKWNIVQGNKPHHRLLSRMLPDAASLEYPVNALRLVFDSELLKPFIVNWAAVASLLLRRAEREFDSIEPVPDLEKLLDWISTLPHVKRLKSGFPYPEESGVLLPMIFDIDGTRLSWFSTIATFGTPQDITIQELRIECLFPADEATDSFVRNAESQRRALMRRERR
jgi:transcriptional regulator with XRE-family HTH domain